MPLVTTAVSASLFSTSFYFSPSLFPLFNSSMLCHVWCLGYQLAAFKASGPIYHFNHGVLQTGIKELQPDQTRLFVPPWWSQSKQGKSKLQDLTWCEPFCVSPGFSSFFYILRLKKRLLVLISTRLKGLNDISIVSYCIQCSARLHLYEIGSSINLTLQPLPLWQAYIYHTSVT